MNDMTDASMDEESRLLAEQERARQAQELAEHPLFKEALQQYRARLMHEWAESPARDTEGREKLWLMLKTAEAVERRTCRPAEALRDRATRPVDALVPIDLVIDHSLKVDFSGTADAADRNLDLEFQRNAERYAFFKWAEPPKPQNPDFLKVEFNLKSNTKLAKFLISWSIFIAAIAQDL